MSSRTDGLRADRSERARAELADENRRDRAAQTRSAPGTAQGMAQGMAMTDGTASTSWQDIKSRFVDDPAGAVAAAEQLVQQAVQARVRALQQEAEAMCTADGSTDADVGDGRGTDASNTEVMRTRLIRYQEYCERLAGGSIH